MKVRTEDEFCIQNEELCIQNEEFFCLFKTRSFALKMVDFALKAASLRKIWSQVDADGSGLC